MKIVKKVKRGWIRYAWSLRLFSNKKKVRWFYKTPVWIIVYIVFLSFDAFLALPQLVRSIMEPEIRGLSLEGFSAAAAFGIFLILYGINEKKPEMPIIGLIGFVINLAIVLISAGKGATFFW